MGHRVAGHENKCASLHGHNYRVHFTVAAARAVELDSLGRVLDFAGVKVLCDWLEKNWDHKFIYWEEDRIIRTMHATLDRISATANRLITNQSVVDDYYHASKNFVTVSFNPTAENMAIYLGTQIAPIWLPADVQCVSVRVEETRKCSAVWVLR